MYFGGRNKVEIKFNLMAVTSKLAVFPTTEMALYYGQSST